MIELPDIILRLSAATLIGSVIGLNRNMHHKPTGLRTLALVALGSALSVLVATEAGTGANPASPVLQGIVTGVGFLGAGVIMHDDSASKVHGLTTAAAIWVTATLGASCGFGFWRPALVSTILTALILIFGGGLEKAIHRRLHPERDDEDQQK